MERLFYRWTGPGRRGRGPWSTRFVTYAISILVNVKIALGLVAQQLQVVSRGAQGMTITLMIIMPQAPEFSGLCIDLTWYLNSKTASGPPGSHCAFLGGVFICFLF